jgi:two-component system, sensor histidine kinase
LGIAALDVHPNPMLIATEGALWGSVKAHGFLNDTVTGIGIAGDKLGDVFERFVQADATMTRRHGGSGLGLTICRDLVSLMGGEIRVESVEGTGTTFTVSLPLPRAVDLQSDAPAERPAEHDRLDGALRILAAEDNATNQIVLKTLLGQVGIEPTLVWNGQEALDACHGRDWDIILMDVQMPIMDGVTAVRAIREAERQQGLRRTPVIAVTANAMPHHRVEYLAAGMDAIVAKPIDFAALLAAMDLAMASTEADHPQAGLA